MATPETRRQLLVAIAACDDKKGEDTRILELDPADSGLADFFLITSATNERQAVAIADEIEFRLKKEFGLYPASVEGRRQAEWILLDYIDLVIHVFLAEKRAFYDIERLRKSARNLTGADVEDELKSALARKTRAVRRSTTPATPTGLAKPTSTKSSKGDSTVSAKPVKKAIKKTAKKTSAKPAAKTAVKKAVKSTPAKAPAKKAAAKKAVAKPAVKAPAKAAKKPAKKAAKAPVKAVLRRLPAAAKPSVAAKPAAVKKAAKKAAKKVASKPVGPIAAAAEPMDSVRAPIDMTESSVHTAAEPSQGVKPPVIK